MAKFTKKIVENSENFLIKKFIAEFKRKVKKKGKGRFSFVLTGGDSPVKLYKNLAKEKNIPWKNIDFFIGDERCVNKNSKYSNINMCKKNLLKKIPILTSQIYKINIKNIKPKKIALEYEKKIKKYFNGKKISFDLTLLGVGNDGHIASLFKNNINKKNKKIVDFVIREDFKRITLTIKCINNSRNIFLWAPGKNKKKIIKNIIKDKKYLYPASYLKSKNIILFYSN